MFLVQKRIFFFLNFKQMVPKHPDHGFMCVFRGAVEVKKGQNYPRNLTNFKNSI